MLEQIPGDSSEGVLPPGQTVSDEVYIGALGNLARRLNEVAKLPFPPGLSCTSEIVGMWVPDIRLTPQEQLWAAPILGEVRRRLGLDQPL